jgi:predicted nucleic acid-binding protein
MMHLVLDTNVLLDLIGNRKPHVVSAVALMQRAGQEGIRVSASSISWTTAFYILSKASSAAKARKALLELHRGIDILDTPGSTVTDALQVRRETDVEDAVQWRVASHHGADAFISRDRRGFRHAEIPVLSPAAWLAEHPSKR